MVAGGFGDDDEVLGRHWGRLGGGDLVVGG